MNRKAKTYFLNITTWVGLTFVASHWYGSISDENGERIKVNGTQGNELTKRMTVKEARHMCEYDSIKREIPHGKKGHWCIWSGRTNTTRFDSQQEVIDKALVWFKKKAKPGDVLRLGNHWNPKKVIARNK